MTTLANGQAQLLYEQENLRLYGARHLCTPLANKCGAFCCTCVGWHAPLAWPGVHPGFDRCVSRTTRAKHRDTREALRALVDALDPINATLPAALRRAREVLGDG